MLEQKVKILNEQGLHARPAGILAKAATKFKATIEIKTEKKSVNAKSLMSLMSLGLTSGTEVTIAINGEDESAAMETLVALFNSKFV